METLNLIAGLLAAVFSGCAARLGYVQLKRDREAQRRQLRCRLRFDPAPDDGPRTVAPGAVERFAFFGASPREDPEPALWKRVSDGEPFEGAFAEVADGRVFLADRVEAREAAKLLHAAGEDV